VIFYDGQLSEYYAPITYWSDTQINCIVPYEVASWGHAYLQVGYAGGWFTTSNPNIEIAATAPGIFTTTGTGIGQAAALNSDLTPNSATNAAIAGSTVSIYMTGEGQTSPPGKTGSITCSDGCPSPPTIPKPVASVTAMIGNQPSVVAFYGEAPGLISGVMQANVVIPSTTLPGANPISIIIGGVSSQAGVRIFVK
jgi:uncharacterized protein (TIGR03437 family)